MKRLITFLMSMLFCFSCGCSEKYAERVSWEDRNFETVELDNSERYENIKQTMILLIDAKGRVDVWEI